MENDLAVSFLSMSSTPNNFNCSRKLARPVHECGSSPARGLLLLTTVTLPPSNDTRIIRGAVAVIALCFTAFSIRC